MVKQILMLISLCCVFATGCQDSASSNSGASVKHASVAPDKDDNQEIASLTALNEQTTVTAYYFHRTMRCPTCLAIEANAQRVIEAGSADEIADGKLMWIPFNLDKPGGKELEKEFDVSVSTLVLAKMQDGNHTNYKKLEKVWDFIGDPVKFDEYVQSEVTKFLNE